MKVEQSLWDDVHHEYGPQNRHTRLEWTLHPPRVWREAVEKIHIHIGLCGGSPTLAIPFSTSEANMISLMNPMDRRDGRDKGYRDYKHGKMRGVREARWTAGGRWMCDDTKDAWEGRGG